MGRKYYYCLIDNEIKQKGDLDSVFENITWRNATESEVEEYENQLNQEITNDEARKFLDDTDWLVIRHRDQLALGVETSLTTEEFQELLQERQEKREAVSDVTSED